MIHILIQRTFRVCALASFITVASAEPWADYSGSDGRPGNGKHIVLVSGDEEYRSEEALSQLAKILSERHGFKCTVLFAVDQQSGIINPHVRDNIPGLQMLNTADLMIIFTRWRILPTTQMQYIEDYLKEGRPVIGMRTSTHAFAPPDNIHSKLRTWKKNNEQKENAGANTKPRWLKESDWGPLGYFADGYIGEKTAWTGGFGRVVLGEKWIAHHGVHQHESTRGLIAPGAEQHPVVRGISNGDVWGPTNVYRVRLPLPGDSKAILLGQVMQRTGVFNEHDRLLGMRANDSRPVTVKNNPVMPVAWTKSYQIENGKPGQVFMTTMGASTDLLATGTRRMIVNGVYWSLGMEEEIPEQGTAVDLVGVFEPGKIKYHPNEYWLQKQLVPSSFNLE